MSAKVKVTVSAREYYVNETGIKIMFNFRIIVGFMNQKLILAKKIAISFEQLATTLFTNNDL